MALRGREPVLGALMYWRMYRMSFRRRSGTEVKTPRPMTSRSITGEPRFESGVTAIRRGASLSIQPLQSTSGHCVWDRRVTRGGALHKFVLVRPARLVLVSEVGAWPPQDLNGIFSTNSELLNASL